MHKANSSATKAVDKGTVHMFAFVHCEVMA